MPAVDGLADEDDDDERLPTRASTHMTRVTAPLPKSSIAGVKGDEAEAFDEYQDLRERAKPMGHVWTPTGDMLVGCAGGQLIKVSTELRTQKLFI